MRITRILVALVATVLPVLVAGPAVAAKPQPGITQERQLVLRAIDRVEVAVTRATDARRLRGLDPTATEAVRANADLDRDGLALLVDAAGAATTRAELRAVTAELRAYQPQVYAWVVASLRGTARLAARVADAREPAAEDPDVLLAVDEADLLVQEADLLLLGVSATTDRAGVAEARVALAAARDAVEQLEDIVG